MGDQKLLTVEEVAQELRVTPPIVRKWLKLGQLQGVKLPGGDWRIRPEAIEVLLGLPVKVGGAVEA